MKHWTVKLIFTIVLSVVVVQSTFEIFLQKFFPEKIAPDFHQSQYNLPVVLRPNLDITIDWFHYYLYPPFRLQTNSKHFLSDREFEYEKPKDVFRILVLGASIFMGLGIENKELFSKNLEDIFNEKSSGKRIEVINFSGIAWSAIEFYTFLKNEGIKYHPDLVIVSQGENDFRTKYNNLIEVNKINKEILSNGEIEIHLEEIKINSLINNPLSFVWEWVRKLPFYLEISKHSQAFYRIRSKVNELWYKKNPQIPKSKQLGHYLETQGIEIGKNTKFSINSDQFSVNPERHSIMYFAKTYNRNMYEAKANIVLHSAAQVKISQLLDEINSKYVVIDVPGWQKTMGIIKSNKTRVINSSLENYNYLNPTMMFKNFQFNNVETPLYYYNNNHWAPAGNRLAAIVTYNFLVKNNLAPTQTSWDLIDPYSPQAIQSVEAANKRIDSYIKTDKNSYKYRGLFYQIKGDYKSSADNLIRYLQLEKNDFDAYYSLGVAFFKMSKFSLALKYFKKSFGGHPLEMEKYKYAYRFAELYKKGYDNYESGNLEEALIFGKKLIKLQGAWWAQGIYLNFLINYKKKDYKNAEMYIAYGLKRSPKNLNFNLIMTSLKFELKQYKQAINHGLRTLMLNENEPKALLILGLSHVELGNKKKAKEMLSRCLVRDPGNQFAKDALNVLEKS